MNTVESLKKLYKTMTGNDWPYDPNPTDAEVIDKIAADATGSGGGEGGGSSRVINLSELEDITDSVVVPAGAVAYQYEPNLTAKDLVGAIIVKENGSVATQYYLIAGAITMPGKTQISCKTIAYYDDSDVRRFLYMPSSGDTPMPAGTLVDVTDVQLPTP